MEPLKIGAYIALLRKNAGLTQAELGERLCVSFQAVSKWERGETLPDTALLLDMAKALGTTVDTILNGGERILPYVRKISVSQMKEGIECVMRMGELLGKDNSFYIAAVSGIDSVMNIEYERYMSDGFDKEALIAEAVVQNLQNGAHVDFEDVRRNFQDEHWVKVIKKYNDLRQ